jgi:hypothetical protein
LKSRAYVTKLGIVPGVSEMVNVRWCIDVEKLVDIYSGFIGWVKKACVQEVAIKKSKYRFARTSKKVLNICTEVHNWV